MINGLLRKIGGNAYNQRWGLWTRMVLVDPAGAVYLKRLRIIQTPFFGVYLHDIESPDSDPVPHSHPWAFISVVLRGGYLEHVFFPGGPVLGRAYNLFRDRFSVHVFPSGGGQVHRIDAVLPRTKTLVLVGRRRDDWGFFRDGVGLVPWREYLGSVGREPFGAAISEDAE